MDNERLSTGGALNEAHAEKDETTKEKGALTMPENMNTAARELYGAVLALEGTGAVERINELLVNDEVSVTAEQIIAANHEMEEGRQEIIMVLAAGVAHA